MMKTIILYGRRNTGVVALLYLVAKGYKVKVISDDLLVVETALNLGLKMVTIENPGKFDWLICVHGNKIIEKKYLIAGRYNFVNIHPTKYNGHNPVKKYIANKDTEGCVRAMYMISEVDAGELIHQEDFKTPVCSSYSDFYNIANPQYYLKCLDKTLKKLGV